MNNSIIYININSMRKIFYFIMLLFGITVANTACDDWTDMEPKFQEDMTQSSLPEEYYAQLRAYKKTDHPVDRKSVV